MDVRRCSAAATALRCVASRPGPAPVDTLRYLISDGPAGQAKLKVGPVLSPGMRQRNPVQRPRCRMRNQNDDRPQTKTAGTGTNTDKFAVVHVKSPFFLILEDLPWQGPIARPAVIWARYDVSRKEQGRGLAGAQERHGGVRVANGPCGDRDQHSMGSPVGLALSRLARAGCSRPANGRAAWRCYALT